MKIFTLIFSSLALLVGADLDDRDYKVIKALKQAGSDISKPHKIDFFLDFQSPEEASPVARAMRSDGFEVKVFKNSDETVTIEAKKNLAPTFKTMHNITKKLKELTDRHGGKYDGWGAEIVR